MVPIPARTRHRDWGLAITATGLTWEGDVWDDPGVGIPACDWVRRPRGQGRGANAATIRAEGGVSRVTTDHAGTPL